MWRAVAVRQGEGKRRRAEEAWASVAERSPDPLSLVLGQEVKVSLHALVAELPDRQRRAIGAYYGLDGQGGCSLEALGRLSDLEILGRPVLVGPSRKSFIGQVLDAPVGDRLMGTAAAVAAAAVMGAHIVRVHDVREMVEVVRVSDAILDAGAAA